MRVCITTYLLNCSQIIQNIFLVYVSKIDCHQAWQRVVKNNGSMFLYLILDRGYGQIKPRPSLLTRAWSSLFQFCPLWFLNFSALVNSHITRRQLLHFSVTYFIFQYWHPFAQRYLAVFLLSPLLLCAMQSTVVARESTACLQDPKRIQGIACGVSSEYQTPSMESQILALLTQPKVAFEKLLQTGSTDVL